jgi:hypothetical protein
MAVIRRARPARLLARILMIGCLAIAISGVGHVLANPARDESTEMASLVSRLAEGSDQTRPVPDDVASSLGYEPVAAGGRLTKPTGGCSTPIPLGPDVFEEACRTHDLGYDLLRSAEEDGHRLGVWARFELDRRLYLDLLSTCETLRCRTAAATYYTAVTTNSIRQGFGAPTDEPTTPWVGVGLLVVCFALLSDPRGGLRAMAGRFTRDTLTPFPVDQDRPVSDPSAEHGMKRGRIADLRPIHSSARGRLGAGWHPWRHRRFGRSTV